MYGEEIPLQNIILENLPNWFINYLQSPTLLVRKFRKIRRNNQKPKEIHQI